MRKTILLLLCAVMALTGFALPPTISAFSPSSASTGMSVSITGTNFTGVTAVTFGGRPAASFIIVSPTQITAVVATGNSGAVQVVNADGNASATGFNYVTTAAIYTDFSGYWPSSMTTVNATMPDSSHHVLGFTYNGATYSTGVNDAALASQGLNFTAGQYKALPVAGISGISAGGSTYLALASKVDGSANVAYRPAVAHYSVKTALTDGINGLDLGTGVTNLPASANLTFQIFSIDPAKIADAEPDIILTQIADPSTGNDEFSFVDGAGNVVGNSITQNMTLLPSFGTYGLDLYNLTPSTPYNSATAYSAAFTAVSRAIRVVAFRLSDFGVTAANVGQIRALRVTPSSNSDYAFIAYNANAINLPPNVSADNSRTNTSVCAAGTAYMAVLASPGMGGALSYTWQQSGNGGSTWTAVVDGGNFAGATTSRLSVSNPTNGFLYRAIVTEAGNSNPAVSNSFTITIVAAPVAPTAVSISGGGTVCLFTPTQLVGNVTGGSNLFYQWESNASGTFEEIPGANWDRLQPVVSQTGSVSYRLRVSSGNGCVPSLTSAPVSLVVGGVASVTPAVRCGSGTVTLNAAATSGTLSWYATDLAGTELTTGTSFITPTLSATTTYFVAASGCASALRVPVTATIDATSVGGAVTGSTTVVSASNSTTLTATGTRGSITKWQSSTDNFTAIITDIANTANQLTVSGLTQTTQYRAVVQNGSCSAAYSSAATITVSGVLPLQAASLRVTKQGTAALVQWKAFEQSQTSHFEIDKSANGIDFSKVHAVLSNGAATETTYQWTDVQPTKGTSFYRIKEVLKDGGVHYSNTGKVIFDDGRAGISLYPNPVVDKKLSLQFTSMEAGKYIVRMVNSAGMVINESNITTNGNSIHPLQLPSSVRSGVYRVSATSASGRTTHASFLVQ